MNFWMTLWRLILYDFRHAIPEVRRFIVFGRYDQIAVHIYVATLSVYLNPSESFGKVSHFLILGGDCQSARLVDKTPLVLRHDRGKPLREASGKAIRRRT